MKVNVSRKESYVQSERFVQANLSVQYDTVGNTQEYLVSLYISKMNLLVGDIRTYFVIP